MLDRRRFLGVSSAALAATACSPADADTSADAVQDELPPSLAELQSMRAQASPITTEERTVRLDRARQLMGRNGMDAMVLTGGTSLNYFTGMSWGLSERMLAVVVPASGAAFVVCPAFERDRAMEQAAQGPMGGGTDVMTWEEHESPYALVADGLRARGVASGTIGIEETVRFVFSDGIAHAAPAMSLTSATPVTAGCRGVKDAHEIALMRLASDVTLKAYTAAWKALREGMTQNDFAQLVSRAHQRLGFSGGAGVQTGEYSALPHGSITPQTIREGTILLIDGGCSVEGYRSDLSRTFVLGEPTQKMKDVFEIEYAAQSAALAAAGPGIECQAVDAAARKVITDAGYGPDYTYFTHRVGHGIGMDGHEWPYLVRGNTLALAPGMTFSDEPGIYIPGEFGIRLEDDMLITESGAELLTPQSPSLEDPFGAPRMA
ncbi:MAG: Xaa-Pro peptidase family protein [Gemmatimonadota bacterium]|jgi:Xaa-Pro dipeptidase